jgi:hypothetical protein
MPAPTADQIPSLIESPQFQALPLEKRKSVAESALAEGAASLAGTWNKDTYQKWGQFAQTVRDRVSASETMLETAGRYATVAGRAIKDSAATVGTMALGMSPVVPTEQGLKGQIPGETLGPMIGANLAGLATGAAQKVLDDPKPLQGKLKELKRGIDEGAFFDDGDGLPGWLDKQDAVVRAEQAKFYRETPDANGAWHKDNSLLGRPENADALNVYLRTRSPEAWQRLEQSILETPGMRRTQQEKARLMSESTLAQGLTPEARPYIQAAGDPAELAGMIGTVGAGNAALRAGRTMVQRGASVAKGVGAEMLSEQVSASMDSAFVPWEQRVQIAKDSLAASLGLMGVGAAAQKIGQGRTTNPPRNNEPVSAGQTPAENPFSGPIEAPPQPTEDGGEVVTPPAPAGVGQTVSAPSRQQVPGFQDDPFNAPTPAAGGNVLRDFGIAKSPQAQAIAEAAEMERQRQVAGMQVRNGSLKRPVIPDSPLGSYDILDFLNENPLNVAVKGSTQEGQAGYDWQERYNIPMYYRKFIATTQRGHSPDTLLGMAQAAGFPGIQSVDDLMNEVQSTINARTQYRVQFRQRDKALRQEAQQVSSFEKDQAKAGDRDKTLVALDDVAPGDEMLINGEKAVVRKIDYDEDGYLTNVVIEDGKRYGVLSLDPTTRAGVFVDEYQPRQREQAAPDFEDPFTMQSVSDEELAAEKARAKQRADLAERQSAALKGNAGEYGTPDMLDSTAGDMALFSQPAGATSPDARAAATAKSPGLAANEAAGMAVPWEDSAAYEQAAEAVAEGDLDLAQKIEQEFQGEFSAAPEVSGTITDMSRALRAANESLPALAQAKWTPEVYAKADAYYTSGNEAALEGLTTIQKRRVIQTRLEVDPVAAKAQAEADRKAEHRARSMEKKDAAFNQKTTFKEEEVLPMSAAYQRPAVAGPLPSTVSNAGPPAVIQTWSGTVQTLHGIRRHLLNTVGLPAVGVGRFKGALGIYKSKPETIRLQAINDLPVLAHEVGHALHFRVLTDSVPGQKVKATDWGGIYDAELMAMGQATSAPTYTPDQVRKEGVAEYIRGWLVDPVGTRAKAPRFSGFFEAEMQRRAPDMLEGLRNTRFMLQDYIAMPAFQKAKAQVVFDPAAERQTQTVTSFLKGLYAQAVNTIQPALDVTRAAAQQPGLETQAAEVEAWMENHRGGWASKAGADVFGHQTDLFGNRVGEGLKSILSGLRPGENESFSTYLALKRAAEIERGGKRSGFENAKLPAAEMQALEARFEPMRQKLIKWQRNERNLLVQAGLLDAKAAADMDAANADYVPFYRLYEKLNGVSFGPEGGKNAGGYVDLNSGIRALKGSDRAIIDPLQSAMKNAFMFRKIAEQNLIGQKFFDLVKEVQGGGKWGEGIAPKMKPTTIGHDAIVQKLVDEGVIKDASMLPSSADLTLRLFQAVTKPDTKNGEVIIFRDGKREHWEVKDPLLMNALRYADADSVKLGSIPSWMVKIMTTPTKVLRWGATGGPWFALPNMIRDAVQGGVLSKSGFVPFVDSVRGAMEIMRKSGVYEQWKEAGGQFSGMVTGSEAFSSLLEDALPKDPIARRAMQGLADPKAWRGGFRNALRLIGSVGQFTEEATRVGEFKKALASGKSEMEAANMSKVVSLNFARAGEVSRVLNQFVPFFNATIQGLDQLVRAHADPKTRGATIAKGLLYITAPSVAVWALGKDDEEIQNLPEWRKNMFWNINLKPLAKAMGEEGFILSIPKPFLLGAIYGTSVERALDYATGRDPNGAKKAAANILDQGINPFEVVTSLAGFKPIYEAWANKSLFTDRNIVPDSMQNLPAEYQYSTNTSETAKMIGAWTGQSPMIIDHLIRGYFATAGKFGSDAIDLGMTKLGVADAPPAAAKGWMEWPILNRFAGSPYEANAFVDRAYNSAKEMEGLMTVWNKQADQMTTAEQAKWWQKNGDLVMQFSRTVDASTGLTGAGQVRKAMTHLGEISKAMKEVQASREMTPDVKATRLRELAKQRNAMAEDTFKTLMPAEIRKKHY